MEKHGRQLGSHRLYGQNAVWFERHYLELSMCVFEFSGFDNEHRNTQILYDADKRTEWKENKNALSHKHTHAHTQNIQFLLIIIKYFTVVCRLRPIQTNVVTVFIFIFRFIVSLCVCESDAGCVYVSVGLNVLTQHANTFRSNPTMKCVHTLNFGWKKNVFLL